MPKPKTEEIPPLDEVSQALPPMPPKLVRQVGYYKVHTSVGTIETSKKSKS